MTGAGFFLFCAGAAGVFSHICNSLQIPARISGNGYNPIAFRFLHYPF